MHRSATQRIIFKVSDSPITQLVAAPITRMLTHEVEVISYGSSCLNTCTINAEKHVTSVIYVFLVTYGNDSHQRKTNLW